MSHQTKSKPNAVRYFDAETLHTIIPRREVEAARKCLLEAQVAIESKPGMGQGTRARVAELYCRLYQIAQSKAANAMDQLELVQASQLMRGDPHVIELPQFSISPWRPIGIHTSARKGRLSRGGAGHSVDKNFRPRY